MKLHVGNAAVRQKRYVARINAERERRITQGMTVTLSGYAEPIPLQGRPEDRANLLGLDRTAERRLTGDPQSNRTTKFRDRNNVIHELTQRQIRELVDQATNWVSAMYEASWALKEMPWDTEVSDDAHWPS